MTASAVVFAYHDVGVRCLSVLLAHQLRIPLVVTHRDDPAEKIWFASVERLARDHGLAVETPADPNSDDFVEKVRNFAPDFIFSFYYRHMLSPQMLAAARRGGYNMHGSLLPKYRGRVPVNWAILKGERETGATLHRMEVKPDAGAIVDQMPVPILPDDVALDVFRKVTVAAEMVLYRSLPDLLEGTAPHVEPDLSKGSYFGGRRPEDGRIDWTRGAREIHDLVRAVAPPYPGAFTEIGGRRLGIDRTRLLDDLQPTDGARLVLEEGRAIVECEDGGRLVVLECRLDGHAADARLLRQRLGAGPHLLNGRNP
ncbi:MAG: formyltransferase [Bacillota bacterium]